MAQSLSPKYAATLRDHRAAERAVEEDAKEKAGQDQLTVLQRWAASQKHGELRTEDEVELGVDILYADGELYQNRTEDLLDRLANKPLNHLEYRRIMGALDYAASRGKPVKNMRRMYRKRQQRLTRNVERL